MNDPVPVTLARFAMATRFELVLHGGNPANLRAAGEEALEEIDRLEDLLSLYRPGSDIGRINAEAATRPVVVDPRVFRLLQRCAELTRRTDGAFDITVAPLVRCWGFMGGTGALPDPADVEAARQRVGMDGVLLDEERFSVRLAREGMMLDLGSIGKGYALEWAADLLRENGVRSALLHGGTSTVCALGRTPEGAPWQVALQDPLEAGRRVGVACLEGNALSVSGVHGKSFEVEGRRFGHVLDPRTGWPVAAGSPEEPQPLMAAVVVESPTEADALSTALLTLGPSWLPVLAERWPGARGLVLTQHPTTGERVTSTHHW